jgi:hypothetical protein
MTYCGSAVNIRILMRNYIHKKQFNEKTMRKIIIFIFASFLIACEAPVGDVGPQGVAGAVGAKGDKGDAGEKGIFNAIVSPWTSALNWFSSSNGVTHVHNFAEPKVTQQVIDKGLILGFYRPLGEDESGIVLPIPDETANYSLGIAGFLLGGQGTISVALNFRNRDVANPNLDDWRKIGVRWIIVPPASTGRLKNVDWKNYNEVKQALNIID